MTIPTDTSYPAIATEASWNKKKTLGDKTNAKAKTGLAAKLKQTETRWNEIRWAQMDGKQVGPAANLVAAKANLKRAQGAYGHQQQVWRVVGEARAHCTKAFTNAALSKGARDHAVKIANALGAAAKRLESIKLDEFQAEVDRHVKLIADRKAAEIEARSQLKDLSVGQKGKTWFEAAKAKRTDDTTVVVDAAVWAVTGQDPQTLIGKKMTVWAYFLDGGKYVNDMTITAIAGKKVTLKA